MSIVIRTSNSADTVPPMLYENEKMLETLLRNHFSGFLGLDETDRVEFVCDQLMLREAGRIDLLFVDGQGLPILVEVKLGANAQSRREVVAQVIDYLSDLPSIDVDEAGSLNDGLDTALRRLADGDQAKFENLWRAVAGNLRVGKAKIVVAVDQAPIDLVRIFRFLAQYSNLNVLLLEVQRFAGTAGSEVFVPRVVVDSEIETRPEPASPRKTIEARLDACANPEARDFFKKRLEKPRNRPRSALAYQEDGKFHWYVEPSRDGAKVTQIDRFDGDETMWRNNLSNKAVSNQKYRDRDNLVFELVTPADFQIFENIVEGGMSASRVWKRS